MANDEKRLIALVNTNAECRELAEKLSAISARRRRRRVFGWKR